MNTERLCTQTTMNTRPYRIMIHDRTYSNWHFIDSDTYDPIEVCERPLLGMVVPSTHKLFTQDSIDVTSREEGQVHVQIVHSSVRTNRLIAGVLILESNKTYGRNRNKKRLLYKCIPDDKHLPAFLIPYQVNVGFSKSLVNKYIVFRFDHWNDKHPHGVLMETLGDVDNLEVFYEYQIYCKSLHASLSEFNEKAKQSLREKTHREFANDIARHPSYRIVPCAFHEPIFTIDPHGCSDFDDAFRVVMPSDTCPNVRVTVFIANVFVWLETLGLWNAFSQRVATIYLPERRRPMLPTILSDTLCSLRAYDSSETDREESSRFAFAMTVEIDPRTGNVLPDTAVFQNECIQISHNYVYESAELLRDVYYMHLLEMTRKNDRSVKDSHDVVSHWMIQMNRICGEKLANAKLGIFRSMSYLNSEDKTEGAVLSEDTRRLIQTWNNTSGQYAMFSSSATDPMMFGHDVMHLKNYIHITSPIRRLVDLLNQMIFMEAFGMVDTFSADARAFLNNWIGRLDYINLTMRSIRKVQTDCEVLRHCVQTPSLLVNTHRGVVFDKMRRNDGTYSYMVYLEQIRVLSRVNCLYDWENYTRHEFKLFVFEEEDSVKHKIRLFPILPSESL